MKRLIYFWNELRATFWFIPVLLILIAVLLSLTFLYVDHRFAIHPEGITRFLLTGSAKAAHDILSTISSAMIGVAGTVFSITLVALTLASSQFGPRLIRNFMYDRINQIVLGSYTATYIYCLIILNSIKDNEQFSFIPSISVLLALVATILNIILLVIFFHHIATNIQAENIIAEISTVLSKNIKDLFPEKTPQEENVDLQKIEKELELHSIHKAFHSKANGYLRYIDSDKILDIANQNDLIVELHYRQGDFLVAGQEFGKIYAKKTVEDQVIEEIQHQFIFGKSRTKEQDLEHSIHQLVEMASRALSPGI
ncbi:MAG: DUF2254 domain-containing protein, partial [Saprospiraceae bacterium]|nr:DUF2254 domain-containing protein [Saprospiraceae bacterium]